MTYYVLFKNPSLLIPTEKLVTAKKLYVYFGGVDVFRNKWSIIDSRSFKKCSYKSKIDNVKLLDFKEKLSGLLEGKYKLGALGLCYFLSQNSSYAYDFVNSMIRTLGENFDINFDLIAPGVMTKDRKLLAKLIISAIDSGLLKPIPLTNNRYYLDI